MNQRKATEGSRVAQEIAAIRAALKKCGYCIHKRPKQAVWKVFNSEHCYLLTYQPSPISAWVLHPQNNDAGYQGKDATGACHLCKPALCAATLTPPAPLSRLGEGSKTSGSPSPKCGRRG